MLCLAAQSCPTLCDPTGCNPTGSSVHGDSLGKNTGVGCHFLLQGIFPTQGSNLHLSPALAVKFFTTSATWEAHLPQGNKNSPYAPSLYFLLFSPRQLLRFGE